MATHAERIAKLEEQMRSRDDVLDKIERDLDTIQRDVRAVRDAMVGALAVKGERHRLSGWLQALLMLAGSLFGGGVGALMMKKFG